MPLFKKVGRVRFDLNEFKNCYSPKKSETLYLNVFNVVENEEPEDYIKYVITLNEHTRSDKDHNSRYNHRYEYAIKNLIYTGDQKNQDDFIEEVCAIFDKFNKRFIKDYKKSLQTDKEENPELYETKKIILKEMQKNGGAIIMEGSTISFHKYIFNFELFVQLLQMLICPKK